MQTMNLKKPIMALSGKQIEEINFDFESLSARDYRQIVRLEGKLRGETPSFDLSSLRKKTSQEFQIATAWIAALKATKDLCLDDIDSLSLPDLLEVGEYGENFILL